MTRKKIKKAHYQPDPTITIDDVTFKYVASRQTQALADQLAELLVVKGFTTYVASPADNCYFIYKCILD